MLLVNIKYNVDLLVIPTAQLDGQLHFLQRIKNNDRSKLLRSQVLSISAVSM